MTEKEYREELLPKILGIANGVRKAVMLGNKRINEAVDESGLEDWEVESLLEFVEMFMHGHDRDDIFDMLRVSPELAERLSRMKGLHWRIDE